MDEDGFVKILLLITYCNDKSYAGWLFDKLAKTERYLPVSYFRGIGKIDSHKFSV